MRLDGITLSTAAELIVTVTANGQTQLKVSMAVDSAGLIGGLLLQPTALPPVPTTWAGVDRQVSSVAPEVRMLVAAVNGNACRPIRAIDAGTAVPLGSAFKLYVLDALARAAASGKVSWNQQLTITSQLKSLPSGELQKEPDGTRVSVRQAADDMISLSDNIRRQHADGTGRAYGCRAGGRGLPGWRIPASTCRSCRSGSTLPVA